MSQEENVIVKMHPKAESTLQRDIIDVFLERWRKDLLTFDKIREILIERNKLKDSEGSKRWLRDQLKELRDHKVIIDVKIPHTKKQGRPKSGYRYNENAIFDLFELTEKLVDAMDFAQVEGEPGKAYITKYVIDDGDLHSLRTPPRNGTLTQVARQATEEDLERTWRLAQHITELQNHCCTESQAYKEYELKKHFESSRNTIGLDGKSLIPARISWEDFRDGFRAAEKSENGIARTAAGVFGTKPITFKFDGPLHFFKEDKEEPK
jgi:hypothetical protein